MDWDDGPSSGSFKLVVCFAASPCQLIEIDAVNKQYAADIAEEIVTLWNDRFPAEGDQASLCGTDIVMFPENKVADIAVVDNGAFKRIPVSGLTLSNGVNVRKVSGCPY